HSLLRSHPGRRVGDEQVRGGAADDLLDLLRGALSLRVEPGEECLRVLLEARLRLLLRLLLATLLLLLLPLLQFAELLRLRRLKRLGVAARLLADERLRLL